MLVTLTKTFTQSAKQMDRIERKVDKMRAEQRELLLPVSAMPHDEQEDEENDGEEEGDDYFEADRLIDFNGPTSPKAHPNTRTCVVGE